MSARAVRSTKRVDLKNVAGDLSVENLMIGPGTINSDPNLPLLLAVRRDEYHPLESHVIPATLEAGRQCALGMVSGRIPPLNFRSANAGILMEAPWLIGGAVPV